MNHVGAEMMPPTTSLTLFTATYYDNYSFKSLAGGLDYVNSDISGQPTSEFLNVNGKPTGAKVNILGSTNYLWSVSYYDDHYRVIQVFLKIIRAQRTGRRASTILREKY